MINRHYPADGPENDSCELMIENGTGSFPARAPVPDVPRDVVPDVRSPLRFHGQEVGCLHRGRCHVFLFRGERHGAPCFLVPQLGRTGLTPGPPGHVCN